jgi:hypothetical protein
MSVLFIFVLFILGLMIAGGLSTEKIDAFLCRRSPGSTMTGSSLLRWGLVLLAAFALGLVVMYVLAFP